MKNTFGWAETVLTLTLAFPQKSPNEINFSGWLEKKLGFTQCKAEQSLKDMELQEKKYTKIKAYRKSVSKEPTVKGCLLILHLKPFRS